MPAANVVRLVAECKAAFGKLERIPDSAAMRLCSILDDAPREALEIMVRENIRFCGVLARGRLLRDFGMTWGEVRKLEGKVR